MTIWQGNGSGLARLCRCPEALNARALSVARCGRYLQPDAGIAQLTSAAENAGVDVDADLLTETLASRLAAIVPDGFHVRAADGMLWYSADEGRFPGQLSNYDAGSWGHTP
jgi:hypothetical protein